MSLYTTSKLFALVILLVQLGQLEGRRRVEPEFDDDEDSRIGFGRNVQQNQFPFFANIKLKDQPLCSGSLIKLSASNSSDLLITAAHCMNGKSYKELSIVPSHLGQNHDQPHRYRTRYVTGVCMNLPLDIAIVKTNWPVVDGDPDVKAIELDYSPIIEGEKLIMIGTGLSTPNGNPERVQYATMNQIKCPSNSELCFIGDENSRTCGGDSGGPLVRSYGGGVFRLAAVLLGGSAKQCTGPGPAYSYTFGIPLHPEIINDLISRCY